MNENLKTSIKRKFDKNVSKIIKSKKYDLPIEIEEKLINGEIEFSDLDKYPILERYVNKNSFKSSSFESEIISNIGLKNTLKFFSEYKDLTLKLSKYAYRRFTSFDTTNANMDYNEAKKVIYRVIINWIPNILDTIDINDLPDEMKAFFPDIFIKDGELPDDVKKRYYKSSLTLKDLRQYKEILKNKNLEIGLSFFERSFFSTYDKNNINVNYDIIWDFLEKLPTEFDEIVTEYIQSHNDNWKNYTNLNDFLKIAIEFYLEVRNNNMSHFSIEQIYNISKIIPLEEFTPENLQNFINTFGFDNLLEFNKNNNNVLNSELRGNYLYNLFAENIDFLDKNTINPDNFLSSLEKLIHVVKIRYDYLYNELSGLLYKTFPNEFIDENEISKLVNDKNKDIRLLTHFYKISSLKNMADLINKYPYLLPFIENKNLDLNGEDNYLYITFGKNNFWDLTVKYGYVWLFSMYYCSKEEIQIISNDVKNKNYDLLNDKVYYTIKNSDFIDYNTYDILNFPESFKKRYSHLYLREDAPKKLKYLFYDFGGTKPNISFDDLKKNPEWIEYLKDKELSLVIKMPLNKNFYSDLIEKFGNEFFLNLCVKYGKYLTYKISTDLKNYSKEEIEKEIQTSIENEFKYGLIPYTSDLPEFLKAKYHLNPSKDADKNIKEIFENNNLTIDILANNPEIYAKIIKSVNIICAFNYNYSWLVPLFMEEDLEKGNIKRLKIAIEYDKLTDEITRNHFREYITENKDNIDFDKLSDITNILVRISTGNSLELLSLEKPLIETVLKTENPEETLKKIENVFIKNNLPLFAKIFLSFQIIYPTMEEVSGKTDFTDNDIISPLLTDGHIMHLGRSKNNIDARFNLIFNDLFRIAVHSGNRSLISYIDNIEKGDKLYKDLVNEKRKFSDLTKEEKGLLKIFTSYLEVLYENTKEGSKSAIYSDNMLLEEKLMFFANKFKPTDRIDLKDRIVRSFAYYAGYKTFDELKNDAYGFINEANKRNEIAAKKLGDGELILDEGDLIRGIGGYDVLSNSINNGNVSKEFLSMLGNPELGNSSTSDMTPLDIDFGKVQKSGFAKDVIQSTPAVSSEIMLVIKHNNPNFLETRDKDGNIYDRYDPKKGDLFRTFSTNHFGVRTGIAISEVDYILYNNPNNTEHLNIVKHELARNGLFVPVIDYNTNKLVFTYEEYKEIREKMQGLKYYGSNTYSFSPNLENTDILEIKNNLELQKDGTKLKRDLYVQHVKHILKKYGIELYTEVTGELETNRAEFIDTGSTGRGTNVPNDGDFDFVLKLDQKIIRDDALFNKLKKDLRAFYIESKEIVDVNNGNFRDKGVIIPGLEEPIDIDITFMPRTDKIAYSTDECIKDRLETIKNLDEEKYKLTVANIVFAKKLLKAGKAYKAREKEGGLGGVGVETWILSHGGSLIDAARSFVKASSDKSLEEFKKVYSLYDFGENHRFFENQVMESSSKNNNNDRFIHDDFVNNLREIGYEKMKEVLNVYIKNVDLGIPNPLEETLKELNPNEYIDRTVYESASLIMEDSKKVLKTFVDGSVSLKKANLGQTGFMYEFTHDGKSYLAKPGVNKQNLRCRPARAVVQEVASSIQKIVSPKTCVDVKVYGKGTVKVAVQERFLNAKSKDASSLIKDHTKELLGEYVCDYLLGNFDSDASNFIIDAEGHLRGIDKEQSLKYTEQDDFEKSLALDFSYMPEGSRTTIYPNLIKYIKASSNYEDYVKYLDEIVHKLQSISDEKYLSLFSDYVNVYDPKDKALMFERILERKKYFEENIEKELSKGNNKGKNY